MFKKLSVRVSVVLILVLGFVITLFTIYLVEDRSEQMRNTIFRKGIAAAQTGAKIMSVTLDHLVDNKIYTREQLFNDSLVLIPIPNHVLRRYGALSADELSKLNQYHYVTGLDTYLDNLILLIEDEFFKDEQVIFAVLSDNKGYTPTHNSISNY
ncbi:MAG: hypothetical protein RIS47_765, partial [Bacteroidota bacterium]